MTPLPNSGCDLPAVFGMTAFGTTAGRKFSAGGPRSAVPDLHHWVNVKSGCDTALLRVVRRTHAVHLLFYDTVGLQPGHGDLAEKRLKLVVVAIHENDLHRFVLSAFAALSVAKPAPDDEDADDGARPVARRCVIGTVASAVQRECDSRGVLRRARRGILVTVREPL